MNTARRLAVATVLATAIVVGCRRRAAPTSRPPLRPVDLHETADLAGFDARTTVTPDGLLRDRRTLGNGTTVRQGRLTPPQAAELAGLLDGWPALAARRYGGVADGPLVEFRYGTDTLVSGGEFPAAAEAARARLTAWAAAMPEAK